VAAAFARRTAQRFGLHRGDLTAAIPVPDRARPPYTLNAVCHPDFWSDPEWLQVQRALGLPRGEDEQHRKRFEWVQCAYGLERLGVLGPQTRVLGVGAGHERVLFYLANRSALTVATDLYTGAFTDSPAAEADPGFARDPGHYAPFAFRREHLAVVRADGTRLPFRAGGFDVVYSLSSIEHFGGHAAASVAMREMARVLRPGGIACVATELVLQGGEHPEFFTPAALQHFVVEQSGMVPVERLHHRPLPRALLDDPVWLDGDIYRNPHLVLGRGHHRWTSVVLFLRKPTRAELARHCAPHLLRKAAAGAVGRPAAG
jgi:SAM-dependent methyltransferase